MTAARAALGHRAEAANRAAAPVLATAYARQEEAYNRVITGLARHPEDGSPLMDSLSLFENLAETGAAIHAETERLVTSNCGLDWSARPALHSSQPYQYRPYGTQSRLTHTEAQIQERLGEIRRRRAEVALVTQRPAAELAPDPLLATALAALRAALAERDQACRGIP